MDKIVTKEALQQVAEVLSEKITSAIEDAIASIPKLSVEVIQTDFTSVATARFNLINEAAALVYDNHTLTRCSNAVIGVNKGGFPNIFTDMIYIYNVWGYYTYDVDGGTISDYNLLVLCMDINGVKKLVRYVL